MKTAAMCAFLLAGCMTDPQTSTTQDELNCGPFCDSDDGGSEVLQEAFKFSFINFPGAAVTDQCCVDLGTGSPQWNCTVTMVTTSNPCGPVAITCFDFRGVKCNAKALDYCH